MNNQKHTPEGVDVAALVRKLKWLDAKGGLGYDAHDIIRETADALQSLSTPPAGVEPRAGREAPLGGLVADLSLQGRDAEADALAALIHRDRASRAEPRAAEREAVKLEKAAIQAIALLDVAIAGTVFTQPDRGRVVVNVAKAQAVLDGLRAALPPRGVGEGLAASAEIAAAPRVVCPDKPHSAGGEG